MRITELWTYPIKGCRGIKLDAATVAATGFENDRSWMIVDKSGMFVTQRGDPKLARVEVRFSGQELVLTADGSSITVPAAPSGEVREVQVWRSRSLADDAGDAAARWLSDYLGSACRLVRTGRSWQREIIVGDAPRPLSFADGFPFLIISEASLADLNCRLPTPVPMTRFRPSIVVDSVPAYTEDLVDTAKHDNGVVLRAARPCVRCAVTTTDQISGERDRASEPLRTLARYRNDRELKGVIFGMNYVLDSGVGKTLRVGDALTWSPR